MGKRVLLVDDSPMVHMLLRELWRSMAMKYAAMLRTEVRVLKCFEDVKKIKKTDNTPKIIMLTAMGGHL